MLELGVLGFSLQSPRTERCDIFPSIKLTHARGRPHMTTKIDVTVARGKTFDYGMLVAAGYR